MVNVSLFHDAHLSGCIAQRKGKVLQKDFRLVDASGKEDAAATGLLQAGWFLDFLELCLDSIYWGPTLIQLGDIIRDGGPVRFDGVELVPRKHVVPENVLFSQAVSLLLELCCELYALFGTNAAREFYQFRACGAAEIVADI